VPVIVRRERGALQFASVRCPPYRLPRFREPARLLELPIAACATHGKCGKTATATDPFIGFRQRDARCGQDGG